MHLVLSLATGGILSLAIGNDLFFHPGLNALSLLGGASVYWIIALIVLWILDGFRPKKDDPKKIEVANKPQREVQIEEVIEKKDDPPMLSWFKLNLKAFSIIVQWGIIFIPLFFAFYLPLFWLLVWNENGWFSTAVIPTLIAFLLSRYFGRRLIKTKFPHLDFSRRE